MATRRAFPVPNQPNEAEEAEATVEDEAEDEAGTDWDAEGAAAIGIAIRTRPFSKETPRT